MQEKSPDPFRIPERTSMGGRNKVSPFLTLGLLLIPVLLVMVAAAREPSQKDIRLAFEAVDRSGAAASEVRVQAARLLESFSQGAIATELALFVSRSDLDVDELYHARLLASEFAPEVYTSASLILAKDSGPESTRRLLTLLRSADVNLSIEVAIPHLGDDRRAETLKPTLRNEMNRGDIPLRVCDVAFNLIQEHRLSGGIGSSLTEVLIPRSQEISQRNSRIKQLCSDLQIAEPDSSNPADPASNSEVGITPSAAEGNADPDTGNGNGNDGC